MTRPTFTKNRNFSAATFVMTLVFGALLLVQQSSLSELKDKVVNLEATVKSQQAGVDRVAVVDLVSGYLNHPYNIAGTLCAEPATACKLVAAMDSLIGSHEPLWLGYDGLRALELADMPGVSRAGLSVLYLDLMVGLNQYGVLEQVMAKDRSPEGFVTSLYRATVAQALVCQRFAAADCVNGLPKPVARSLGRLMAYVAEQGPKVAPYATSPRLAAVTLVADAVK